MTGRAPGAVVLGAGGRIGRELLPMLAGRGFPVAAITRNHDPGMRGADLSVIPADVTERPHWPQTFRALSATVGERRMVVIADLILDRSSVPAMRQSIAAASAYTRGLARLVTDTGGTPRIVAASTTATLAPWIYQTPYGLAKRRQADCYATTPGVQLVLLPILSAGGALAGEWAYRDAAHVLAAAIQAAADDSIPARRLWAPAGMTSRSDEKADELGISGIISAHLECVVTRRDDPGAHRRAARGRLWLTPRPLREKVDHHYAPDRLTTAFAHRTGLMVRHMSMIPGQDEQERTADG